MVKMLSYGGDSFAMLLSGEPATAGRWHSVGWVVVETPLKEWML